MNNTHLQSVLKSLPAEALKRLNDFMHSPYFAHSKSTVLFWESIGNHAPQFELNEAERAAAFTRVAGKRPFHDATYRNLVSDLYKQVLLFLKTEQLNVETHRAHEFLFNALLNLGLPDLLEKEWKSKNKSLPAPTGHITALQHSEVMMEAEQAILKIKYRHKHEEVANQNHFEKYISVVMDNAFSKIFKSYFNLILASRNFHLPFNEIQCRRLIQYYEDSELPKSISAQLHFHSLKLQLDGDEVSYRFLKKGLFDEKAGLIATEKIALTVALVSFISNAVNSGLNEMKWRKELFEIYDYKVSHRLWYSDRPLTYPAFINIAWNALLLGKISYAERFIDRYAGILDEKIREQVSAVCKATVLFFKKKYEEALTGLAKIETENIILKFELRTLQCLLYFEMKEWDLLQSHIDSFRHFIAYNKKLLPDAIVKGMTSFCNYLFKLIRMRLEPEPKGKKQLQQNIEGDPQVFMQQWLLQQLKKVK